MPMICPICNCEYEPVAMHVELGEQDKAWRGGRAVNLPPQQAEAAYVVSAKSGEFASIEEIMCGLYGRRLWEDHDPEILPTMFARVRHKLRPLGVTLLSAKGQGYALRLIDGCACLRPKPSKPVYTRTDRHWTDSRLRPVARLLARGYSWASVGVALGISKGSVTGAIQRNRKRVEELIAHEANIAMGARPRDVLRVPVSPRLERG